MARPRKNDESQFLELAEEWRSRVEGSDTEALKTEMLEVNRLEELNQRAKDQDQQLKEAKEAYSDAGAGYKEASRKHYLKKKFILSVLNARGTISLNE